jgi:hypothetical protein
MAVATKRHLDVSNMFQKPAVTEWVLPPSCSAVCAGLRNYSIS